MTEVLEGIYDIRNDFFCAIVGHCLEAPASRIDENPERIYQQLLHQLAPCQNLWIIARSRRSKVDDAISASDASASEGDRLATLAMTIAVRLAYSTPSVAGSIRCMCSTLAAS